MRAVVIEAPTVVQIAELPDPEPGAGDVVVEVALTGVCGTDIHMLDGDFATARFPIVPGHEVTGTVVARGTGVVSPRVGERVVVDPGVPCMTCLLCRRGRPNLCEHRNAVGITLNGGAADRVLVAARNCHVIPDSVSSTAAVLAEPLACVLHAFDMVPRTSGRRVLIYGAGPVGLLAVQVAGYLGAHSVDTVDLDADRRAVAQKLGASKVFGPSDLGEEDDWDLVIDASGAPTAIEDGLGRLQRGGTFLQLGVAPGDAVVPLSPYQVFARELTIVGSMTTRHTFPGALRLLESGTITSELIVEEPVPLSHYAKAVDTVRGRNALKVVVGPGV
ncbi:alcohol dehydrogenase catalytic domain-containing protein [Mycobacterium neglectum]|uniref:alcohol dehydrogenase catalytic domain-containing protein n=1 Tax=Mycobacterium neglectum TaxID=242737 RepID=UPI000BFED544|nr:alcohol dehydrogenase catalytic domain-containing protein [Mycobacterium neglectum]